jgi:hypothetical protein
MGGNALHSIIYNYGANYIVSEKENGTIEQMNVTSVGKFTLIIDFVATEL